MPTPTLPDNAEPLAPGDLVIRIRNAGHNDPVPIGASGTVMQAGATLRYQKGDGGEERSGNGATVDFPGVPVSRHLGPRLGYWFMFREELLKVTPPKVTERDRAELEA